MKSDEQIEALRAFHEAIEANKNGFPATSEAFLRLALRAFEDGGARVQRFVREQTISPLTLPPAFND